MRTSTLVVLLLVLVSVALARRNSLSKHRTQGLISDILSGTKLPINIDLSSITANNCKRFNFVKGLISNLLNKKAKWQAALNDFSCWGEKDLKRLTGAIITPPDFTQGLQGEAAAPVQSIDTLAIPANFNTSTAWPGCVGDIRYQGSCGSCWSFSGNSVLSDRYCIASGGVIKNAYASNQQLVSCGNNNGCSGGQLQKYWDFARTNGVVTETCYPYSTGTQNSAQVPTCSSTCVNGQSMAATTTYRAQAAASTYYTGSYMVAPYKPADFRTNIPIIQNEIMKNGPVQAAFQCTQEFMSYKSGVYECVNCTSIGGHAVKIIGWGTTAEGVGYWIIANSWGINWGMSGNFWMKFGQLGIEDTVYAGLPVYNSPVTTTTTKSSTVTTTTTKAPTTATTTTTTTTTTKAPTVTGTTTKAPTTTTAPTASLQSQTITSIYNLLKQWFSTKASKSLALNSNASRLSQTQANFFTSGKEPFGNGGWTSDNSNWFVNGPVGPNRWTQLYKTYGAKGGFETYGYRYDALPTTFAQNTVNYLVANIPNLANYNSVGIGVATQSGTSQTFYVIEFVV